MAYPVADEFGRTTAQPRFSDEVFDTLAERDAFASGLRYEGMLVYVKEDETSYRLKGGTDNVNWVVDGGGSGSGVVVVADIAARDAIPDDERTQGMIVFVEDIYQHFTISGDLTDDNLWRHLLAPIAFGSPSVLNTIVAVTGISSASDLMNPYAKEQHIFIEGNGAGETIVSANPQITPGTFIGQIMYLHGGSNDNVAVFHSGDGLSLNGEWKSYEGNILGLIWNDVDWTEFVRRSI